MNSLKIIPEKDLKEKPNQEEIWNNIALPWRTYVTKKIPFVEEFLERINFDFLKSELSKNQAVLRIIDLGCGTGRNMIPNENIEYDGVDFSEKQLKQAELSAQEQRINAKLFKQDISKLDKKIFKNEMFDYGLFIATLHCLETKKARLNALKEFYRVLRPGAEAIISVWNSDDSRFNEVKKEKCGGVYMSWQKDRINYMRYYYLFEKQEFLDFLKSVGFKIQKIYERLEHDRFSKKNWIVRIKKGVI